MPQREPLTPTLLAAAGVVAAFPAAWLVLAADALASGVFGSLAGFHWGGMSLAPSFTLRADLATDGSHGAALWATALLAGPIVTAALALAVQVLVESTRSPAWLRVVALEALAFAWLRIPALLVAGSGSRGRGPVAELYLRLGDPQVGRWPAAVLAIVVLAAAAAVVNQRVVDAGRSWMRADGRPFRRRLVRVLAGYPTLVALAGWSVIMPWAPPVWTGLWLLLTLSAMHVLVS